MNTLRKNSSPIPFGKVNILTGIMCIFALLGSQRIIFASYYAFICLVFFGLSFLFYNRNREKFNTLIIFSIFLSVDNGANTYNETPSIIRYIIYLAALLALLPHLAIMRQRILLLAIFLLIPLVLTVLNITNLDVGTLRRDALIFFLIVIVLCRGGDLAQFKLDLSLLSKLLVAFLMGEYVNIFLFFSYAEYGYLNYDSTKSIVVLPALYYLRNSSGWVAAFIFVSLLYVLLLYATRMLSLVFLLVVAVYYLSLILRVTKKRLITLVVASTILIISTWQLLEYFPLNNFKFTNSLLVAFEEYSIEEALKAVDYVRYGELKLFLDRNAFAVAIGDGFGAGLFDKNGFFDGVSVESTAFSGKELETKYFYNFHDVWVDVGLRFGLIFILFLFIPLFNGIASRRVSISVYSMFLIVLICCAFFSSAGLIMIGIFGLAYRASVQEHRIRKFSNKLVLTGTG